MNCGLGSFGKLCIRRNSEVDCMLSEIPSPTEFRFEIIFSIKHVHIMKYSPKLDPSSGKDLQIFSRSGKYN